MKIKEEEFLSILDKDKNLTSTQKDKELKKQVNEFTKNEINENSCATKRKKGRTKNLETSLADTEMHKAQLKVEVYIGPKDEKENNNNEMEKVMSISGIPYMILCYCLCLKEYNSKFLLLIICSF